MEKIKLTKGQYALVDDEDFERVSRYSWHTHLDRDKVIRAVRTRIKGKMISLGSFLMHPDAKISVDHINRNPLDNRRINLRLCSHAENSLNRGLYSSNKSGIAGVYYDATIKKWVAELTINGDRKRKRFLNKEDAIKQRQFLVEEYCGEFAPV